MQLLVQAFQAAQMDVIVFFDGTLKENKKVQMERNDYRQRTISVSFFLFSGVNMAFFTWLIIMTEENDRQMFCVHFFKYLFTSVRRSKKKRKFFNICEFFFMIS